MHLGSTGGHMKVEERWSNQQPGSPAAAAVVDCTRGDENQGQVVGMVVKFEIVPFLCQFNIATGEEHDLKGKAALDDQGLPGHLSLQISCRQLDVVPPSGYTEANDRRSGSKEVEMRTSMKSLGSKLNGNIFGAAYERRHIQEATVLNCCG
ncbi:unnamed protein product [Arctogadus glacialis]